MEEDKDENLHDARYDYRDDIGAEEEDEEGMRRLEEDERGG